MCPQLALCAVVLQAPGFPSGLVYLCWMFQLSHSPLNCVRAAEILSSNYLQLVEQVMKNTFKTH